MCCKAPASYGYDTPKPNGIYERQKENKYMRNIE